MIQRLFGDKVLFIAFLSGLIFLITIQHSYAQGTHAYSLLNVSKDSTFDVVTWNIEWFGSEQNGPEDLDLQFKNVLEVIRTLDADLYAFQEIVDKPMYFSLRDSLKEFSGFYASYQQDLKTAYMYRTSIIDSLDSGLLTDEQDGGDWAGGRYPLFFEFDLTIAEKTLRVFTYNLHSKAFSNRSSYNQRRNSAASLKNYLDGSRSNASIIVLGDFNDGLTSSTFMDEPSPYAPFVEDNFYLPITMPLEEAGEASYLSDQFQSFIDHIVVTNAFKTIHIQGTQKVEDISYIENFRVTTSDHLPVSTRFDFTKDFKDTFEELPEEFLVGPNYPNPFNSSTKIPFELEKPADVSLSVYDLMGRKVSVILNNRPFNAGTHTITFHASGLSSGIYIYRMLLDTGESRTQKISLIK